MLRTRIYLGVAAALVAIVGLAFTANTPGNDFHPVPWEPGADVHHANAALDNFASLALPALEGPEDLVFDSLGRLYAGTSDGWIIRVQPGIPGQVEKFAEVGGRPLGLAVGPGDEIYVANHGIGLQSVTSAGAVTLLTDRAGSEPILFADGVVLDSQGIVYLSDASALYNSTTIGERPGYAIYDYLGGRASGRLISFDPRTATTQVLAEELYFPNGLALSSSKDAIWIAESTRNRISRYWIGGELAGQWEVVAENLAGVADGLHSLGDGRLVLTAYYRNAFFDRQVLPSTVLRHIFARLPAAFWERVVPQGYVAILDDQTGKVLLELHASEGSGFPAPASAVLHEGKLYFGTLRGDAITFVDFEQARARAMQEEGP